MREDIRLVIVSGPRGAGKDSVATALVTRLPGLQRIVAYTTRTPRQGEQEGREYHFVSDYEFEELVRYNRFIWFGQVGPFQRHGILEDTLKTPSSGSVLVTLPHAARTIRERITAMGGKTFLLAVFASRKERWQRIRNRQVDIAEVEILRLMREDPVSPLMRDLYDFDARIFNRGTNPEPAYQRALKLTRRFLRR